MDWFLYDNGLRRERVKGVLLKLITLQKAGLNEKQNSAPSQNPHFFADIIELINY